MSLRGFFGRRRQPIAHIDPDPLRTPDDALETGIIIGATGNQGSPWFGIAIKNLKDRRIATGGKPVSQTGRAGRSSGTQAGHPPDVS